MLHHAKFKICWSNCDPWPWAETSRRRRQKLHTPGCVYRQGRRRPRSPPQVQRAVWWCMGARASAGGRAS